MHGRLCVVFFAFLVAGWNTAAAQYTLVPDPAFELQLINLGIDSQGILDGQVLTADVTGVTSLNVPSAGITDLTGIEDFAALQDLRVENNNITSLDLSANSNLVRLYCNGNRITTLDLSGNPSLNVLRAQTQQAGHLLTAVDLSANPGLTELLVNGNDLAPSLDASGKPLLTMFNATNNPNLACIQVDDEAAANAGAGIYAIWLKDATATYSQSCAPANTAPVIISNGGGDTAEITMPSGQTQVTDVDATDEDAGDVLTYSITGGADAAKFSIDATTGELVFVTAPDFANPTDADADNVYNVQVSATDDGAGPLSDAQDIAVTVAAVRATFLVSKTFTDGSPASVTVALSCNSGLPLQQSMVISTGNPVNFVVTSYASGAMDCSITETEINGYTATYVPSGDSQNDGTDGCHFSAIGGLHSNACAISNEPAPVTVSIRKEWVIEGAVADEFIPAFALTLHCDSQIVDGTPDLTVMGNDAQALVLPTNWYKEFSGIGDATFPAQVIPRYPSTHCRVEEDGGYSAVEVQNGCTDITVSAGSGASCTITNTVFYEGIPTLSQWGLAILVLLVAGFGIIGVRRG